MNGTDGARPTDLGSPEVGPHDPNPTDPNPTDTKAADTKAADANPTGVDPSGPAERDSGGPVRAEAPASSGPEAANLPQPIPHAGARYAALRLLMLAAVGGILYLVGLRGWLLAIAAVLVSGVVSLFLFMRQRNDAAVNLEYTMDHWKHRHDHDEARPE